MDGTQKVSSVEELIQRCQERGMPLEKMRFFIGENRTEPRCFGIYQDPQSGYWVVYKNKADGSRAVRYNGPDEAYAANEIWMKINSEIEMRRARLQSRQTPPSPMRKVIHVIAGLAIAALISWGIYAAVNAPKRGYYIVDNDLYYYQNSAWYVMDDLGYWLIYDAPEGDEWYDDCYYGSYYPSYDEYEYGTRFENTDYYVEPSDDDSDSDVFDSWDSFDTDWDSDW